MKPGQIAGLNRSRVLSLAGSDDILFIATSPGNVVYCSGYRSPAYDTDPTVGMAVVFDTRRTIFVGPVADLWGAAEILDEPISYYGYGKFAFDDRVALAAAGIDFHRLPDFGTALTSATKALTRHSTTLAIDQAAPILTTCRILDVHWTRSTFRDARAIKSAEEVALLRTAAALTEASLASALKSARAGVTEFDVAADISAAMLRAGMMPGFVVVTSGPRTALADAHPTARAFALGDLVRIDLGGTLGGYWSDTACSAIVGEPSAEISEMSRCLLLGQETALDGASRLLSTAEIFRTTVEAVRRAGLSDYQRHHVGHGLGVEPHEFPTIGPEGSVALMPGMVMNVETPYYRPGWGGLMFEDTFVVGDGGIERLTTIENRLLRIDA